MPDIIDNMPKTNSNISTGIEGFTRINVGNDDFSTEFRASFIQCYYIENNQKNIDIDFACNDTSQEDAQSRREVWG